MRASGESVAILGSTCEITSRFADFAHYWRENPTAARFALQSQARSLLPDERVRNCLRTRISRDASVEVFHHTGLYAASYGNLQTCASSWHCPVCASKIATRRREELSTGLDNWVGGVVLATFTLQHVLEDTCVDVLNALRKAYRAFWSNRPGRRIAAEYGVSGKTRGLEVTHTANGWHWHLHVLMFLKQPGIYLENLRRDMLAHWQNEVARAGRFADSLHGLDIRSSNKEVVDYVSKYGLEGEGPWRKEGEAWTEAHELALAHVKRRTKKGGLTPFQLLALSLVGDKDAGPLFTEFAKTVKGKSQLHYSKGLRDLLGLKREKSDAELAAEQDKMAVLLARLTPDNWKVILGNDARSDLLKVARTGDPWLVLEFLEDLGVYDVYLPGLVDDPNYHGPHRRY